MRQWQMLRLIPRQPFKISTSELMQGLADEGFETTPRTLQRDLVRMSSIYPLLCDDRDKPFGWSWSRDANVHEVPGIDSDTALAFYLAEKHLEPLLPRTTIKRLEPHFKRAEEVLDQADADKGNPAWRNKVRVLHRGPALKSPFIDADVQSAVYDALLRNRKLDVAYLPRGADVAKQYELNPLGLVLKDGLFYLVCSMWDYTDIRLITLHRMNTATVMDIPCAAPDGFDLDAYIASGELDFAIGGEIKLKARISRQIAIHLEERPLHEDQKLTPCDDDTYLLETTAQDTNELRWWLLGFGSGVEVLEPANLREAFKQICNEMAINYERKPQLSVST